MGNQSAGKHPLATHHHLAKDFLPQIEHILQLLL